MRPVQKLSRSGVQLSERRASFGSMVTNWGVTVNTVVLRGLGSPSIGPPLCREALVRCNFCSQPSRGSRPGLARLLGQLLHCEGRHTQLPCLNGGLFVAGIITCNKFDVGGGGLLRGLMYRVLLHTLFIIRGLLQRGGWGCCCYDKGFDAERGLGVLLL